MNALKKDSALSACLLNAEEVQDTLDMRSFQLKTLNDLSKELFASVDTETIIRKLLLATIHPETSLVEDTGISNLECYVLQAQL